MKRTGTNDANLCVPGQPRCKDPEYFGPLLLQISSCWNDLRQDRALADTQLRRALARSRGQDEGLASLCDSFYILHYYLQMLLYYWELIDYNIDQPG